MTSVLKKKYYTLPNEFTRRKHDCYTNLSIVPDIGIQERIVALIKECQYAFSLKTVYCFKSSHGGYIPVQIAPVFKKVILKCTDGPHYANIMANIQEYAISNILFQDYSTPIDTESMIYLNDYVKRFSISGDKPPVVLSVHSENHSLILPYYKYSYSISHTPWRIYIAEDKHDVFCEYFSTFLNRETCVLSYDNLNHFCMIVKNAGEQLEEMLNENMCHFDEWTIVDTGSTDDTIAIIERVLVGKKRGKLYHRPFVNFRDTRNICLDLAVKQHIVPCKYLTMLDDTYVVYGDLRKFFMEVRGDQFADSFSMFVRTDDTVYTSNRIIRVDTGLRYKYKIHEIIDDNKNINVLIPKEDVSILDRRFSYMEERSMKRKRQDLQWLKEEIEDNPHEPRHYYYLGQTYYVMGEYHNAFDTFQKRVQFINNGFIQERLDAAFESARIANFKLNWPWEECLKLYEKAWSIDDSRPESLYFIGIHYYFEENYSKAYKYFKQAFQLGFPVHCQHSLKPTLSFHFLPIYLAKTCYYIKDWKLGLESAQFFLQYNKQGDDSYEEMVCWVRIFSHLVEYSASSDTPPFTLSQKGIPVFCFLADGGFEEWSGKNILTKGVGGSETYIIEMARHIQKMYHFQVVVFCKCSEPDVFEDVIYRPIKEWFSFVKTTYVHTCVISRYTDYIPTANLSCIENIHVVLHDLIIPGSVIIDNKKMKNIFCLTPWHCQYVKEIFPSLSHKFHPFSYGINADAFPIKNNPVVPYSFIYSSFPDRGLLPLLKMWSHIIEKQPKASLDIFCDLQGEWVNRVQPEQMSLIRGYLDTAPKHFNIRVHGWTDKQTLYQYWARTDIWFYPCIFKETFCMTALEAAASRTLAITNDLAALQNTVGDRGIVIPGDAFTPEWQNEALKMLFPYLSDMDETVLANKNTLLDKNAKWASSIPWSFQAETLCKQYVFSEPYERMGMYNWTDETPTPQDKEIFLKIIYNFSSSRMVQRTPITLLEIGCWTGISLINLLQNMPLSTAYAIDSWTDYNELDSVVKVEQMGVMEAFKRNISRAGMEHRVKICKGDSCDVLLCLNKEGQTFDFIYVDGSHLLLETYMDCVLAWTLLNKGGIMVIDDYMFEYKNEISNINRPKEAVDHFLKKKIGEYNILNIGYRVFLEKI